PALGTGSTPRSPEGESSAAMPARMLREVADALEAFTQEQTLVIVLEDLHWADRSTVDLIGCLGRRRQPARLLVIGSLRPAQASFHDHPLLAVKHMLENGGLCSELSLERLSRDDVTAYLGARFGELSEDEIRRLSSRI